MKTTPDGKLITLMNNSGEKEVDKIISTFKFTNEAPDLTLGCDNANKSYYEIKELGIKFLVDSSIKDDLIYKYNSQNNVAYLSAKSLSAIDSGCGAESGPLGAISKIKGTPKDNKSDSAYYLEAEKSGYIKQLSDSFVFYQGPQAVCSSDQKNVDKVVNYSRQLINKIYFVSDIKCVSPAN